MDLDKLKEKIKLILSEEAYRIGEKEIPNSDFDPFEGLSTLY